MSFEKLLFIATTFLFQGCAAMYVADHVVPKEPQHQPDDIVLEVPYIEQTDSFCGPSSLAMVANYYGNDITVEEIADVVYTPNRQGSLQIEMVAATRNLGLVPYAMNMDLETLYTELDQERPVIVFQNLSLDIIPKWHYSVVTGRSPDGEKLLLHSGRHQYYRVSRNTFENTWRRGKNWALVAAAPGDLPLSADHKTVINTALDLERVGKHRLAQITYEAAATRWPESFAAHVGLANMHMQLEEPVAASKAYRTALLLDNRSAAAMNNFAYSAYALGCEITAINAASCAMALDKDKTPSIQATLKELTSKSDTYRNHLKCPSIYCKNKNNVAINNSTR